MKNECEMQSYLESLFTSEELAIIAVKAELQRLECLCTFWEVVSVLQMLIILYLVLLT